MQALPNRPARRLRLAPGFAALPPPELGCRNAGKLRQEGKDYVVQDGDVMRFKFNV